MRTGEIRIGGRRLETGWWGPPPDAAPTLVLLHEGLGCVALWRDFPAALVETTGCGVFAWSRFGYGGSDPAKLPRPLDYMEREATEVLPAVLAAAAIRRCILIGHSDGASIAAIHAGAVADDRVRGLVLLAPHYFVEPVALASIAAARLAYEQGDLRPRLARYHSDVDCAFRGWNDAWLDPGFPAVFGLAACLARIRVPVLQLQGDDDPFGTPAQPAAAERLAPVAVRTLMLPGVRHAPHIEAAARTVEAVTSFVAECLQEGAPAL